MTEQNKNAPNEEYDEYITRKYQGQIEDGNLKIQLGYKLSGDPEVTNLQFLEKFDIKALTLVISNEMNVKFRSITIKELTLEKRILYGIDKQEQRWNWNVNDLELENLEVLELQDINLVNNQLYNLAKFKKLHTLDVSDNKVNLSNIHSATSLTRLAMQGCGLMNVDQISSLVNLKELDISQNRDLDLSSLYQVRSLIKLSMTSCGLTNIDQITQLINLEVLNLASNQLQTIKRTKISKISKRTKYQLQQVN
ncbi:Conserved_hypothetical protein [Hexamita inflata]|uniref:Uncharacterized protein n=1 Tax=Hexamita inflata TaxID=28002 RepID=A0AA86UZI4_9EUKA|nr:Conserved hypothetical protein [Hexamita inflata]